MKRIALSCLVLLLGILHGFAQGGWDKPAYRIYTAEGTPAHYSDILAAAEKADVVLFGERHNGTLDHWLNLELVHDLFKRTLAVDMSFEQFEADQQPALDSLLGGDLSFQDFERTQRVWPNYATDYRPMLEFAFEHSFRALAANVPRDSARTAGRNGVASLALRSPAWPPLPLPVDTALPGYAKMRAMMAGHGGTASATFLVEAQALKDAVMAWRIARFHRAGVPVVHTAGAYHVQDHSGQNAHADGIAGYLGRYAPFLRVVTVVCVEQHHLESLTAAAQGQADFIVVVPDRMTKTY